MAFILALFEYPFLLLPCEALIIKDEKVFRNHFNRHQFTFLYKHAAMASNTARQAVFQKQYGFENIATGKKLIDSETFICFKVYKQCSLAVNINDQ